MHNNDYEIITVNTLPGKPRRKKLHGRDYLVVNATLLMEGVLNGSRGPLYYPPEEIAANPGIWNHVPIVVWHPKDSNGNPTLARQPEILEEYGIGLLFNDRYEDKKRLAEAWFDEKRTTEFDTRLDNQHKILPRINAGKPVELSTGLHTKNYPAPAESVFNAADGTSYPYTAVARSYLPEHLAALPDQKGACSINYGCGFNVNNTLDNTDVDNAKKLTGGHWVTTDSGNHLYIRGGSVVAGNPHVVAAVKGDKGKQGKDKKDKDDDGPDEEGRYPSKFNKSITYGHKDDRDSDDAYFAKEIKKADDEVKRIKSKLEKAEAKLIDSNPNVADLTKRLHDVNATIAIETEKRDESRRRIEELKKLLKPKKKSTNNAETHNSDDDTELTLEDVIEILNYQPRSANTGQYKSIGSGSGKDPWHSAAQKGAMVLTDDDIADGTSASAEVGEKGHNPVSWVADEGKWEKAKSAAREGGYAEGSDQFWAVTSHIYKQMGGKKKETSTMNEDVISNSNPKGCNQHTGPGCGLPQGFEKEGGYQGGPKHRVTPPSLIRTGSTGVIRDGEFSGHKATVIKVDKGDITVDIHDKGRDDTPSSLRKRKVVSYKVLDFDNPTTNEEDVSMAKSDDIKYLTANCECWKGKDTILNGMTDAEIASWRKFHEKVKKDEHVANAVASSGFTVNSENKIEAVENAGECPKCGGKMKEGKCQSCGYTEKATMNTLNLDDPKVLDAVTTKLFGLTANESKAVMTSAKKIEQRERFGMVHKLVANVTDEKVRNSKVESLLKLPTEQLELLISYLPEQTHNSNKPTETELFMQTFYGSGSRDGSQGAPSDFVGNRGQHREEKPDVEGGPRIMPTLNYDECSDVGKKVRNRNKSA